jgi:hypothetical protein
MEIDRFRNILQSHLAKTPPNARFPWNSRIPSSGIIRFSASKFYQQSRYLAIWMYHIRGCKLATSVYRRLSSLPAVYIKHVDPNIVGFKIIGRPTPGFRLHYFIYMNTPKNEFTCTSPTHNLLNSTRIVLNDSWRFHYRLKITLQYGRDCALRK